MAENIKESAHLTKKRNKSQDLKDNNAQESLQDKIDTESKGSSRDVLVEELSDLAERVEQFEDFKFPETENFVKNNNNNG